VTFLLPKSNLRVGCVSVKTRVCRINNAREQVW